MPLSPLFRCVSAQLRFGGAENVNYFIRSKSPDGNKFRHYEPDCPITGFDDLEYESRDLILSSPNFSP